MKNKICSILFISILFIFAFMGVSAAATTVKEKTSNYEGEVYIIGSTRFKNTVITAEKAAMAGVNEARLYQSLMKNLKNLNLKLYLYDADFDEWYVVTESDTKQLTEKEIADAGLDKELEIFFVNNEEKTLEFPYQADKTKIEINEYDADEGVTYDGTKFSVPATVLYFTFTDDGTEIRVNTKADYDEKDDDFEYEYGKFETQKVFTVSFICKNVKDEEAYPHEVEVFEGKKIDWEAPYAYVEEGYEFIGWFEEGAKTAFDLENTVITRNVTLYPKFLAKHTVNINGNNITVTLDDETKELNEATTENIVTVTPSEGYSITEITVMDENDTKVILKKQENGTYTFNMPDSNVTINVTCVNTNITTEEELNTAINSNVKNIKLQSNLNLAQDVKISGDVTLDLNGKNITAQNAEDGFVVTGNLTISDSTKTGKVENVSLISKGGNLTLKDVTVEKNVLDSDGTGYAIFARDGGTVTVDGATITSIDSPLSGNNTTGKGNFVVKSGTLTAQQGPAIYMPCDGIIDISGGTLNGGLSIRMGEVNISGGTINATTGDIDAFKDYYGYSGNVWLADALYVWNGSYQFNEETAILKLNITGGTFNCENGKGRAIAIYDLGRFEQNTSVKVSENAVLKTNTPDVEAFQVLSFEDMGVTLPENSIWGKYHVDMSKIEK